MEQTRVVLSILALVSNLLSVQSNDCDNVFPGVPTFGLNCQHRCHCYNDDKCSESRGCTNGRCNLGWMGPLCQYRNIAKEFKETAQEGENFIQHSDLAVDGNLQTCSETNLAQSDGQQAWRVQLNRPYRVVGVKIHILINDLENFANFRIETGPTSLSFPNLCYEQQNKPATSEIEIICLEPVETQNIRITQLLENVPLRICEFEIYGGREIAFNMPTNQSTDYGNWLSSRAVDGRYPDEGEELIIEANTCSRTDGLENNPWLYIDLQQDFKIQDMSFYGRHTTLEQSKGFYISVGEVAHSGITIFQDTVDGTTNPAHYSPRTTELTTEYVAKVVQIGIQPYSGTATLSVCEMHIFADCVVNKCGWNCEKNCYCDGEVTGKMKIDGICPYGCSGRWTGQNGACDIECGETEWGEMCKRKCGNCLKFPCDLKTGQCGGGCSGPWLPPLCTQACEAGTYGTNC
ncbi:uncharacterized protein LOC123524797 isoform X1 [Mercenaria mercenaria]|uniref:uncharacterized protein LOC123524797 isoform X1 n=2 Tax=Mercenaria mercenaria TaxID=6596 RepID=UPI001E1D8A4C|nr:uncharacterized protein LOC123524797 isoform X1 [Mercenaria mercenaria]